MLKAEECQEIVNRVINILDRNINIIDLQGIVIASSNTERVGTFHEGGRLCAASGEEVIITEKNKHLYRGCKEGINLPIQYKHKTIGIVGITGNPDEIKPYGLLVKELVELIVQEKESRYTRELHDEALKNFILELIKGIGDKDEEAYIRRGKLLGVGDLRNKVIIVGSLKSLPKNSDKISEIKTQETKQKILDLIKNYYKKEGVITFYLYDESFIMILPNSSRNEDTLIHLKDKILKGFKVSTSFICSEVNISYKDYATNYNKVEKAVIINKNKKDIVFLEKYGIELLLHNISNEDKEQYLEKYEQFFNKDKNSLMEQLIETVKAYFENNMHIGNTAKALYLHRNTINYRINKIEDQFMIDITKPYQCMKLYIAICLTEQPLHQ